VDRHLDKQGEWSRPQWSHDYPPLPGHGGYLPMWDVLEAVLGTGFRGWLSIEVFDSNEMEGGSDTGAFTKVVMDSFSDF
jgi:sugar phosphate isomerase/epimerase